MGGRMRGTPVLNYRLPSRPLGSFGASYVGRAAEWITLSWLRLETFLVWLVLVPLFLAMEWPSSLALVGAMLGSPLMALFTIFTLKVMGWAMYFVPGANRVWGWGRIAFLWAFSRLVVEAAPELEMPTWSSGPRS